MVNSNTSLIKKENALIHKKRFSDRIILNQLHDNLKSVLIGSLDLPHDIHTSNVLNIKTSIYNLQKEFKSFKAKALNPEKEFSITSLDNFSLKLETSGFYTSTVELEKKHSLKELQQKISQFFFCCLTKKYKPNSQWQPLWKQRHQFSLGIEIPQQPKRLKEAQSSKIRKKGSFFFSELTTPKFSSIGLQKKQQAVIRINSSILRKNYSRLLESRIFSFFSTYKKNYKLVSAQIPTNKIQLRKILNSLKRVPLKFEKRKKYYYKKYKRLAWKRKKRKNRKKTGLLGFLRRRRRRLLFQFSVPRHFEINYKTFEMIHLGEFDLNTTNSRIPYWLNLRRLLTFLSR
jgi:hypothetical protein